jgi:hypothetical protein
MLTGQRATTAAIQMYVIGVLRLLCWLYCMRELYHKCWIKWRVKLQNATHAYLRAQYNDTAASSSVTPISAMDAANGANSIAISGVDMSSVSTTCSSIVVVPADDGVHTNSAVNDTATATSVTSSSTPSIGRASAVVTCETTAATAGTTTSADITSIANGSVAVITTAPSATVEVHTPHMERGTTTTDNASSSSGNSSTSDDIQRRRQFYGYMGNAHDQRQQQQQQQQTEPEQSTAVSTVTSCSVSPTAATGGSTSVSRPPPRVPVIRTVSSSVFSEDNSGAATATSTATGSVVRSSSAQQPRLVPYNRSSSVGVQHASTPQSCTNSSSNMYTSNTNSSNRLSSASLSGAWLRRMLPSGQLEWIWGSEARNNSELEQQYSSNTNHNNTSNNSSSNSAATQGAAPSLTTGRLRMLELTGMSSSSEDSKACDNTSGNSSDKRLTREILDIVTALPFDAKLAWFRRHLTVHQEEAATALLCNTNTTSSSITATTTTTANDDDSRSLLSEASLLPTVYNHGNGVTSMLPIRGTGLWGSNMDDHHTITSSSHSTRNNTSVNSSNRLGLAYNSSSTACDVGGSESPRRHHHHLDYQQQSNLIEVNRSALLQSSVRAYLALSSEELKMPLRFRSVVYTILYYIMYYNMCVFYYAHMQHSIHYSVCSVYYALLMRITTSQQLEPVEDHIAVFSMKLTLAKHLMLQSHTAVCQMWH